MKSKYWLEKHRYYELKHFCLRYPQWKSNTISQYGDSKSNGDDIPLFVRCSACNELMDYKSGLDDDTGEWVYPVCGASVDEYDAYTQLGDENDDFLEENDLE